MTSAAGTQVPDPASRGAVELVIRDGRILADPASGAPLQVVDDGDPSRQFLLDHRQAWHSLEHDWGTGHVLTDRGAHRWNHPASSAREGAVFRSTHPLGDDLALEVERRYGDGLQESYQFVNRGTGTLTITSIGVQTPFADVYGGSEQSLAEAVHAHVFTGGTRGWVLAQPMDGAGRVLGLILQEGHLSAYSIESRNQFTGSNVRGHVVLHPTDAARNPTAFGGQPRLTLEPGESYELRWHLALFDDVAAFTAATAAPMRLEALSARVGTPLTVTDLAGPLTSRDPDVLIDQRGSTAQVTATRSGIVDLEVDGAVTAVAFHRPVEEVVRARVGYIMRHQVASERPGLLRYGLVPIDTVTGLTQSQNGWSDWTDGSERIGMALLLQQAYARGWAGDDVHELLTGWALMAETHLMDPGAAPRRGSQDWATPIRLYDSPWLCQFFLDRYRLLHVPHHLDLAARILERSFELGGGRFLAIGASEAGVEVVEALEEVGEQARADRLRRRLLESADHFVSVGRALPAHEVNYEQSIVAPLLDLLLDAARLSGDDRYLDEVGVRLPWLRAFGGPQPHVRLRDIAIRHWDGYWFGTERLWGDVFPHYWSSLTAAVLLRLPDRLRTPESDRAALDILRANLLNHFDDGSATCAFVMPSTVDGRAAHRNDRLANDQDRHLGIWLHLADRWGAPLQ